MTKEDELREIRIVELAYEMQEDDDDDEPGDGSLKAEYYEAAKREIEGGAV